MLDVMLVWRILDFGYWMLDIMLVSRILNIGCWVVDVVLVWRILSIGYWIGCLEAEIYSLGLSTSPVKKMSA